MSRKVKILETIAQMICSHKEPHPKNDQDGHLFSIRHVHLPQSRNDDQQNSQIGRNIEHGLGDLIIEICGALLLRRGDHKIPHKRTTVEKESKLDSNISGQSISCADFDPELAKKMCCHAPIDN